MNPASNDSNTGHAGEGTRPTTSGGVDNIGAGEKFAVGESAAGEANVGPAPAEQMAAKRKDAEASRHDDSAPFGLRQDPTPETSRDPTQPGSAGSSNAGNRDS